MNQCRLFGEWGHAVSELSAKLIPQRLITCLFYEKTNFLLGPKLSYKGYLSTTNKRVHGKFSVLKYSTNSVPLPPLLQIIHEKQPLV